MVAASNVQKEDEVQQIVELVYTTLDHYVSTIAETNNTAVDTSKEQNFYTANQKQNPHTPKVMMALGLNEDEVNTFIQDCLFPEI
jgi:hypothetical protein